MATVLGMARQGPRGGTQCDAACGADVEVGHSSGEGLDEANEETEEESRVLLPIAEPIGKSAGLESDSFGSSDTPSKHKVVGTMSTLAATTNLITCMIGASVLSLPRMVANSGWLCGPLLLVLAGCVSCRASLMVNRALEAVSEIQGYGVPPRHIGEVAEVCFGLRSKSLVLLVTCFFQTCKCGVYFVVVGTNLHYWAAGWTSRECTLAAVCCGVWLVFIRSVATISKGAFIGAAASLVYVICIGSAGLKAVATLPAASRSSELLPPNFASLPQIFAVMLYSYSPADVIPTLKRDMLNPERLHVAAILSHVVVGSAYFILACAGYYGWGSAVAGNVLESMCDLPGCPGLVPVGVEAGAKWASGYVLSVSVVVNLMVTIPIVLYCVFSTMESEIEAMRRSLSLSLALRTAVVLISVSIALFIPFFVEILAVISTALLVFLQLLLPCVVSWTLSRRGKVPFDLSGYMLFVLGVLVMVIGLNSALSNLAAAVRASQV